MEGTGRSDTRFTSETAKEASRLGVEARRRNKKNADQPLSFDLGAIKRKAEQGDVPAARLLLEIESTKHKTDLTTDVLRVMEDCDLKTLREAIAARLSPPPA